MKPRRKTVSSIDVLLFRTNRDTSRVESTRYSNLTIFLTYYYIYISFSLVINFYFSNCNVAVRFHLNRSFRRRLDVRKKIIAASNAAFYRLHYRSQVPEPLLTPLCATNTIVLLATCCQLVMRDTCATRRRGAARSEETLRRLFSARSLGSPPPPLFLPSLSSLNWRSPISLPLSCWRGRRRLREGRANGTSKRITIIRAYLD